MLPTDFLCRQEVALCVCMPMLVDDPSSPLLVQFFSCCLLSLIKHNGFVYLLVLCVGFWVMESLIFHNTDRKSVPLPAPHWSIVSVLLIVCFPGHLWPNITVCFKPYSCCCSCGAPYCDEVTSTQNSLRPLWQQAQMKKQETETAFCRRHVTSKCNLNLSF